MSEEQSPSQSHEQKQDVSGSDRPSRRDGGASMRARRWTIADNYYEPVDYDIPELPRWTVAQKRSSRLSFAEDDESEPFISAEHPVRVRR